MNIKSVLPQTSVLESRHRVELHREKEVTSRQSGERDANGKQEKGDHLTHRPLTDEEIKKALEILEELPGLQASSLKVRLVVSVHNQKVVIIEDMNGEMVRRLTETDLWHVLQNQTKQTGQILDKTT